MSLFSRRKRTGRLENGTAMRIVVEGKAHDLKYEDLCLSNMRSIQALAGLLIRKGVITGEELLEEVKRQAEAFRPLDGGGGAGDATGDG